VSFPNTSVSERWATPQWLFDRLNAEFRFDLDAAADASNHKCDLWFGPDGLVSDSLSLSSWSLPIDTEYAVWHGASSVWCNPPYSKKGGGIYPWMVKGLETARAGAVCVMLIYARTDTRAWSQIVHPYADEVRLIAGRLKFEPPPDYTGTATTAGAPSAVIVFRPETAWMGRPGGAQYRVMEQP